MTQQEQSSKHELGDVPPQTFDAGMWTEPLHVYGDFGELRAYETILEKWHIVQIIKTDDEDFKVIPVKTFNTQEEAQAFMQGVNFHWTFSRGIL